jgi:hypothetical protein
MGALSWEIERGRAGDTDLAGLRTVLALMYDDDEPGSPWRFMLYVDDRGDDRQRAVLSQIFLGRLGGTPEKQFPWVWKASELLEVRVVPIDVDHTPGRGWFRAGGHVTVRIGSPVDAEATVTCVIPGHNRSGREVHADVLRVEDGALDFDITSRCGYEADFSYSSGDS